MTTTGDTMTWTIKVLEGTVGYWPRGAAIGKVVAELNKPTEPSFQGMRRRRAAVRVFSSRHATVIGPTPPGTGVMAPATAEHA